MCARTNIYLFNYLTLPLFRVSLLLVNIYRTLNKSCFDIFMTGSGAGTIFFSLVIQAIIERLGLRWAFFINAFISCVILIPVILLLKSAEFMSRTRQPAFPNPLPITS